MDAHISQPYIWLFKLKCEWYDVYEAHEQENQLLNSILKYFCR